MDTKLKYFSYSADIFAGNEDKIIHMLDALRTWAEGTDVAMSRAKMTTSVF